MPKSFAKPLSIGVYRPKSWISIKLNDATISGDTIKLSIIHGSELLILNRNRPRSKALRKFSCQEHWSRVRKVTYFNVA